MGVIKTAIAMAKREGHVLANGSLERLDPFQKRDKARPWSALMTRRLRRKRLERKRAKAQKP